MKRIISTKQDILSVIAENQSQIKALGIKQLGLFGSFVRDEATDSSDVDFLVEFEVGHKNFDNLMQLSLLLEEVLARPVELVTPEALSVHLQPYIMDEVENVPFVA